MANIIESLSVRSFDREHLDVFWKFGQMTDPAAYAITVERSTNQLSDYAQLGPASVGLSYFRDTNIKTTRGFYHHYYYRLKIRDRRSGDTVYFPEAGGVTLEAPPDLVSLELARQRRVLLEAVEGRKVWLFQRRRDGARCRNCWDAVLNKRTKSVCTTCYGVGIMGGFHAPVETVMKIRSPPDTTSQTELAKVTTENTTFLYHNFPDIGAGDLIVDPENSRWTVGEQIVKTQRNRVVIDQKGPLTRLPTTDILFKVPLILSVEQLRDLQTEPRVLYVMPHNLQAYAESAYEAIYNV